MELKKVTQLSWRKFLLSDPGTEGMLYLREKAPSIHTGTSEAIIFEAGRAQGFRDALDAIANVIGVEPKETGDPSND